MYSVIEDYFARWLGALVAVTVMVAIVSYACGGGWPVWLAVAIPFMPFVLATAYVVVRIVRRNRSRPGRPLEDRQDHASAS